MLLNSRMRVLIAMLTVILLGVVFWFGKGEALFDAKIQPWASFYVPPSAVPLNVQITVLDQTVTLCNQTQEDWSDILVQMNGGFLAKVDRLSPAACQHLRVADFASPSWKRLPPPNNMRPHSVEVIAGTNRRGYARRLF
jgi:hypothetical protein